MRKIFIAVIVCVLNICGVLHASSADLVVNYKYGEIPESLAEFIGKNTVPTTMLISTSKTVLELAKEHCSPTTPDVYLKSIAFANPELFEVGLLSEDISQTTLKGGTSINLPNCLPSLVIVPRARVVREGESLWQIYQESELKKAVKSAGYEIAFGDLSVSEQGLKPFKLQSNSSVDNNNVVFPTQIAFEYENSLRTTEDVDAHFLSSLNRIIPNTLDTKPNFDLASLIASYGKAYELTGLSTNEAVDRASGFLKNSNYGKRETGTSYSPDFVSIESAAVDSLKYYLELEIVESKLRGNAAKLVSSNATLSPSTKQIDYNRAFDALNQQRSGQSFGKIDRGEIIFEPTPARQAIAYPLKTDLASDPTRLEETAEIARLNSPTETGIYSQIHPLSIGISPVDSMRCSGGNFNMRNDEIAKLSARLLQNKQQLFRMKKLKTTEVVIRIPDTGFLYDTALSRNPFNELHFKNAYDTAQNRPSDLSSANIDVSHGTSVGALALGGPKLLHLASASGYGIRLEPRSIYRIGSPISHVEGHRLMREIEKPLIVRTEQLGSALRQTDIVNLSIGGAQKLPELERFLGKNNNTLFVVAAGNNHLNDAAKGVDINRKVIYPAKYGGNNTIGKFNVITVASIDSDNSLSKFSNFGTNHVQLAAPGCGITSWGFNNSTYKTVNVSGTSFAAPFVSYAAGLVNSIFKPFNKAEPTHVKARLLASANLIGALATDNIEDGRILNLGRAVSVFNDIIEFTNNSDEKIEVIGELVDEKNLTTFCDSDLFEGADLLKIARHPIKNFRDQGYLLYYYMHEEKMITDKCKANSSTVLQIKDEKNNEIISIPTEKITDIIFKSIEPNRT